MTLLSIAAIGVYRDLAPAASRISGNATINSDPTATPHPGPATAQPAVSGEPSATQDAGSIGSFGQVLVAQIPSEALVAYTTLLALFAAGAGGYQPGRWILYGLSLPACAAATIGSYLAKRTYTFTDAPAARQGLRAFLSHLPWLPTFSAVLAMAVYGLTIPGSALEGSMSGTGYAITAGCLAVGGGLMMSIITPFLARGNSASIRTATAHTTNAGVSRLDRASA